MVPLSAGSARERHSGTEHAYLEANQGVGFEVLDFRGL